MEFRELLELSSLYLAFADQQFTQAEQNWVDTYLGQGTADRFINQAATIDWQQTLDRTLTLSVSLTAEERSIFDLGIREWLMQMLAVDGVEQGVVERLDQYLAFLQVPTQPPQSTVTPPPPPAEEELPPPPPLEELPPPSPQEPPPRKAPKTSTKEIHIDQDGEKYGPYNLDKVNDFLEEGRISSSAIAWHKGLSDWIPITEIDGVVAPKDEGPPLRPPNKSTPDEPPPKRKLQPEKDTGERVYYDNNNVLVTSNRYVVEDDLGNPITYAIKNITSVTTGTYEVEKVGIMPIIGVIGVAVVIKLLDDEMFGGDIPDNYYNIPIYIVLAILVVVFLFELFSGYDYYYSVDNVTASGNEQSYTSDDKQEIDEIVNALNEAIING